MQDPNPGFSLQFSHVDTECYQRFLNELSKAYSDSLNILQVDQGQFHQGKIFNCAREYYSVVSTALLRELNPTERFWEQLKALKWDSFKTLAQRQTFSRSNIG